MKKRNLLVVSDHYLTFIKDQLEIMSENFNEIDVALRYHAYYLFKKNGLIDSTNIPSNVNVFKAPVFHLPLNFNYMKLGDASYKRLGKQYLKSVEKTIRNNSINFDLIHAHFTWPSGYVGAMLKKKYNVPLVITAHGYDIYDLPFRDSIWKEKIEYVLNSADQIITVSNRNLDCIRKLDVKTPVKVIPNGFKKDLFYPRNQQKCREILGLPPHKKIIITVGNLVDIKRHGDLIEAMGEIVKSNKNILCIIVGGGKLKNKLEKQICSAGLGEYVKLVGGRSHDEIPIWINTCDLFVLPSLKESFGVVQVEAMACGKPVVATYNGGSEEVIISDKYGMLTATKDPKRLATTIMEALSRKWEHEAIKLYAEQFEWDNITEEIMKIYEKICVNHEK